MTSKRWKAIKVMALFLAFAVSQVYVQASLFGRHSASPQPAGAQQMLIGRIMTRQNKPVMVNGNSVPSGTTIFSGAQVRTPAGTGATIDLGPLGRVDIGPNTNLTLTFGQGEVSINLQTGYVMLTTNKGTKGAVINPQGAVTSTDPTKLSSVIVTVGERGPDTAAIALLPAAGVSAGTTAASFGAAAAALATGGLASSNGRGRGRNLSPTIPRGPR